MNSDDLSNIALVIGVACLFAALLGRRSGNDRRDVRLMSGVGAGLGGLALVISSNWI